MFLPRCAARSRRYLLLQEIQQGAVGFFMISRAGCALRRTDDYHLNSAGLRRAQLCGWGFAVNDSQSCLRRGSFCLGRIFAANSCYPAQAAMEFYL